MNREPYSETLAAKAAQIEGAMAYLEIAIEDGPDGNALECLYLRLESELAELKSRSDMRQRIQDRRKRRAMLAAA